MKTILVLAAGTYYVRALTQLREAGFRVLAADRDPHAPGASQVHGFAPVDITNGEQVLAWAYAQGIDGVMAVNDFGVRTAAYVAERLGLPGITPEAAEVCNDKGLMRDRWAERGLAQPAYAVVHDRAGLAAAALDLGFPLVLKPTDCGGSGRGISVLRGPEDLDWSLNFALPYARNGRLIAEAFLDGTEMTVEAVTLEGKVHILAMSDKVKPELRTRVATSLNYPAAMPEATLESVRDLVCRAVLGAGVRVGMSHTEVIVTASGPQLVEIGARGGGGHVFHTCIEAVSGVSGPTLAARLLTNQASDLDVVLKRGCVYRFFNPPQGILRAVHGIDEARNLPGVLDLGIIKQPGQEVGNLENSLHRAGFVVTCGRDRAEAVARADAVERSVRFDVKQTAAPEVQQPVASGQCGGKHAC